MPNLQHSRELVSLYIDDLENAHKQIKWITDHLTAQFEALILPGLGVGAVIDTNKLGPGYQGKVMSGRGYGSTFKITGNVRVKVESRPSLSRWIGWAISVDPTDHERTLGSPVFLEGRIFPILQFDSNQTEKDRVMQGYAEHEKLMGVTSL